jgi:hypothetical protein
VVTPILGGIQVTWDRVEFDRFDSYEVQTDDSSIFSSPTTFTAYTNRITIKDPSLATTIATTFIRVRVIAVQRNAKIRGSAGPWSASISDTLLNPVTEGDTDNISPENRTVVAPQPRLVGLPFDDVPSSTNLYVGTGGAVGPGPFTFTDTSGSDNPDLRNQISYTMQEALDTDFYDAQTLNMGLPTNFNEPDVDEGARIYNTLTGSFTDFFYIYDVRNLGQIQVEFLDYTSSPHENTGVVQHATLGIIKY